MDISSAFRPKDGLSSSALLDDLGANQLVLAGLCTPPWPEREDERSEGTVARRCL